MVEVNQTGSYGWSARIDLYGCNADALASEEAIQAFVETLCVHILDMRRHGTLLIDWFGSPHDKTGGYSFVQLIETSSVVGHISEARGALYLDIFSCREFDSDAATQHAIRCFGANEDQVEVSERR